MLDVERPFPLRVHRQENEGRFLARWRGISLASAESVLLIDSRVLIAREALRFLARETRYGQDDVAYNGFVLTDDAVPLVGRFWDAPVWLFWGKYLASPHEMRITPDTFDRLPKGLGMFYAPKRWLVDAMTASWPEADPRLVSDDTKVIRHIAEADDLRITPEFSALYRPRVSVLSFLAHARMRGTLFVDSYAGTTLVRSIVLILLVIAPPVLLIATGIAIAVGAGWLAAILVLVVLGAILGPAVAAAIGRCPARGILAYLTYIVPFAAVFWFGLARGSIVHRAAFHGRRTAGGSTE